MKDVGKKIRAAFVAGGNPHDIRLWSGTPYHMLKALEERFDMVAVIEQPWPAWYTPLGRILKFASFRQFEYIASPAYTGLAARKTLARLRAVNPDIVFAVSLSPMTHLLAKEFRTVHIADATVRGMMNYYQSFSSRPRFALRSLDRIEEKVIRRSFLSLFPSRWAAESATKDYGAAPDQICDIAWGANFDPLDVEPRTLPKGEMKFLFVGVDWKRKGGQIALDTIAELTRRGIPCRLDVVGCTAEVLNGPPPPNVTFHGFISKANDKGKKCMQHFFESATFFIFPTIAECFAMSLIESVHFGLPLVSYCTGGLPSMIRDGKTGILLPLGASSSDFADAICNLIAAPNRYAAMSQAALIDAKERLNWDKWASEVEAIVFEKLLQRT